MKFLAMALIAFSTQYSLASISRTYVCKAEVPDTETRTGRIPPRPIAYVTVTGQETGGNKVGAALSIPRVRQGGRYTRTLTQTVGCPQKPGSQPDYSCNFKEEKYRLDVPLMATTAPEEVGAVNTATKKRVSLFCELKGR